MLETGKQSSRSHSLENSLWKRLWTCSKTDNSIIMTVTFSVQRSRILHYSAGCKTKTHHLSLRIQNKQQQSFLQFIASFHQLFLVLISGLSPWLKPPPPQKKLNHMKSDTVFAEATCWLPTANPSKRKIFVNEMLHCYSSCTVLKLKHYPLNSHLTHSLPAI